MIGVTGTNGKTTTSQWIAQALEHAGRRCGVIGTLGAGRVGALAPLANTTPDAALFHETLARFRDDGLDAVAMEVSSIGLEQGRVNGATFDVAVFTNLTRDHLDYHGTMQAYGAAKSALFSWPGLAASVVNADDPFGQSLVDAIRRRGGRVLAYGAANADVAAHGVAMGERGLVVGVSTPVGPRRDRERRGRRVQRGEPAREPGRAARERRAARRRDRRARARRGAARAACSASAAASGRSSSSTTRTRPTRSRRCSRRCGPRCATAANSCACSAAAATATRASGR